MPGGERVGEEVATEGVDEQGLLKPAAVPARRPCRRQRLLVQLLPGGAVRRGEVRRVDLCHPQEAVRGGPSAELDVLQRDRLIPLVRFTARQPACPLVLDRVPDLPQLPRVGAQQFGRRGVEVPGHCHDVADAQLHALDDETAPPEELVAADLRPCVTRGDRAPERRSLGGAKVLLQFGEPCVAEILVLGRLEAVDDVRASLCHVNELVGDEVPPLRRIRPVPVLSEDDVLVGGVGGGAHRPGRAGGGRSGVDPDAAEVAVEVGGQSRPVRQRPGPPLRLALGLRAWPGDHGDGTAEHLMHGIRARAGQRTAHGLHGKSGANVATSETASPLPAGR